MNQTKTQTFESPYGDYPATRRLGNPDTAAAGDSKQLRETMHDTTEGTCKTLSEAVQKATEQLGSWQAEQPGAWNKLLGSWQNKSKIYRELVEDFRDCFATAEEDLTEEEISKAFMEALKAQRDYYLKKKRFYLNLRSIIRSKLIEEGWEK